ncbi:MAG: hypothetical protein LUQ11_12750 [Methylococcaceae bacterium]|nr:hypothetical protein [Methylococcaceae bacterium]
MIIFLRKIPANTKLGDITDFVTPALKGGLFRRPGKIIKVEILTLHDTHLNTHEFHGLITIEPDSAGVRAIRLLKGRRFKDKLIIVRQYVHRSWHNDPRQSQKRFDIDVEKRKTDRRRGKYLETIRDISGQFSSAGDFARKNLP